MTFAIRFELVLTLFPSDELAGTKNQLSDVGGVRVEYAITLVP